jgi:CelD/BcsL family acetyltransferase involved in cellulose biosynthesis
MPVEVKLYDDLDAVERAAAEKLDRSAQPSLFSRLHWFRLVERHAPPPGHLLVVHGQADESDAWLFLAREGKCARAFGNWYSLRVSAGANENAIRAAAAELRRLRLARVELSPIAIDDPLPRAFHAAGWLTSVKQSTTSWQIETAGMRFEDYWATRPSRLRNTARRKAKAVALEYEIHCEFNAAAWQAYEQVFAASWKPNEGSPAFLRALAEQEGAAGTLRLGIARRDGEPIAAQLWLVEGGQAWIHKLAYVESMRDLSAGTLLSVEMFRHALDVDRVERIDFGTGDDGYKAEWMDRPQPLNCLVAFNPSTISGLAGFVRAVVGKLVRRFRSR